MGEAGTILSYIVKYKTLTRFGQLTCTKQREQNCLILCEQISYKILSPFTDEQVFYDKIFMTSLVCQVYVCMHNNFL